MALAFEVNILDNISDVPNQVAEHPAEVDSPEWRRDRNFTYETSDTEGFKASELEERIKYVLKIDYIHPLQLQKLTSEANIDTERRPNEVISTAKWSDEIVYINVYEKIRQVLFSFSRRKIVFQKLS